MLARHLYHQLATHPQATAGQALARARYLTEEDRTKQAKDHLPLPEYGLATLLTRDADGPLVDPAAPAQPLTVVTTPPGGKQVRELPMGALIGRRAELRTAMRVLRRDPVAVDRFGVAGGVVLTGIGGIGKTALAGRIISRLRDDGWLSAVHEGRWNPTALITAVAEALRTAAPAAGDPAGGELQVVLAALTSPDYDDGPKIALIARLLSACQLLLVLDDFEQNLTTGGDEFLDPAFEEVLTRLAELADTGAVLITSRYPLPGPDRFLVRVPVPALSAAELRRMFLRLPALADLPAEDRALLMRTIGSSSPTHCCAAGGPACATSRPGCTPSPATTAWPSPSSRRWTRRWTRRWCWAAPTSCSPNCSPCSPPGRPPWCGRSRYAAPR
jgi:hypothetical protein